MKFETRVLLTRYGPPPNGLPEPSLTVFHSRAAWDEFVKQNNGARETLVKLSVDWSTSVLLLVRTIPEGGMDLYPSISVLSREGDVVDIQVIMIPNPNAQMLDVLAQPWLIAEASVRAFAGDPKIRFSVRGQPEGKIDHQRR